MPLQATSGAASYDAFGGGPSGPANYIEDVFSTWLYTQNTTDQNIPLQTGVGFTSSDAWQSNTLLAGSNPVCTFDSSGNYYLAASDGSTNTYIAKFTSTGVKTWQVNLLPSSLPLIVNAIRVAPSGAVYVSGGRNGSLPAVCKLTSSGVVSWTRELGSGNSTGVFIDLDSSENVHVAYTNGSNQGQYARFDSSGTQDTANSKTFTTSIQTYSRGVTVDSSGNVYICGDYYDGAYYYGYVIKFNSSMTLQWNRSLFTASGTPRFSSVSVDSSGNVYVAGQYRSTNDRPLFAKYNSAGTFQWAKNFFQTGVSFRANAIKVDASGNSYVAGLGPDNRWFIARIDTNGDIVWQKVFRPTSAMNTCEANAIDIDSLGGLLVSGGSNESTSSSTVRSQVLKIGQGGLSNGVTAYGTLATSSLNYGNAGINSDVKTFTVSSGSTFSSVTYTSSTNSVSTVYQNIPLSTSTGALLWTKNRSASGSNILALSNTSYIQSNTTGAAFTQDYALELVSNGALIKNNITTDNWASWTFRKQPKFFDVVTYTGNGSASQTIAHSLGSQPGCIIVKRTDSTSDWGVWHRNSGGDSSITGWSLNSTSGFGSTVTGTAALFTSTSFRPYYIEDVNGIRNTNGATYVAYLFAHNAGGFGLTGTDNVISCGSYTGNGADIGPVVTLGYEPQWLMIKNASGTGNWNIIDNMRGMFVGAPASTQNEATLQANLSNAESYTEYVSPTSTGFQIISNAVNRAEINTNASTYIYIAIRRGPMKVPTTGTSVFGLSSRTGTGANSTVSGGQTSDAVLIKNTGASTSSLFAARLTGTYYLATTSSAAQVNADATILQANPWDVMDGVKVGTTSTITNASGNTFINYLFRRSPGFFDVVTYTGNSANRTIAHNLNAVPELIIVKGRSESTNGWPVYSAALNTNQLLRFDTTAAPAVTGAWNSTRPTSSIFTLGANVAVNADGATYIAYLFASCPGISKVGSYTGTGATQVINCGFTGGARFVLIKATSTTGGWYVWDSARGIVAGNDPYILLNSTAAEVTTTDWVDTAATGFELSNTVGNLANSSGATYIFLAIA
jgi:hypothetical protein